MFGRATITLALANILVFRFFRSYLFAWLLEELRHLTLWRHRCAPDSHATDSFFSARYKFYIRLDYSDSH